MGRKTWQALVIGLFLFVLFVCVFNWEEPHSDLTLIRSNASQVQMTWQNMTNVLRDIALVFGGFGSFWMRGLRWIYDYFPAVFGYFGCIILLFVPIGISVLCDPRRLFSPPNLNVNVSSTKQ